MQSDLRERVAKAIAGTYYYWNDLSREQKDSYMAQAKNAITALQSLGDSPDSGARYRQALVNIRKRCFDDSEWGRYIDAILRLEGAGSPKGSDGDLRPGVGCEDCKAHPTGDYCPEHFAEARKIADKMNVEPSGTASLRGAARLEEPVDADLRPFGWAPGNYSAFCAECRTAHDFTDKRSARCRPCAVKRFKAQQTAQPSLSEAKGPSPSSPPSPASQGAVERAPEAPALAGKVMEGIRAKATLATPPAGPAVDLENIENALKAVKNWWDAKTWTLNHQPYEMVVSAIEAVARLRSPGGT